MVASSCLFVSDFVCLLVMTVMYAIRGFPWAAALLWLPVLLGLAVISRIVADFDEVQKETALDFRGPHHRV